MLSIDLNCDLGESADTESVLRDEALLGVVTSANIACGAHAGDERLMRSTVRGALARGVSIGAHPGYPDRDNFGRRSVPMRPAELERSVADQIAALTAIVAESGARIRHLKPHGALYHDCARNAGVADAVARAVLRVSPHLALVALAGPAGATCVRLWRAMGLRVFEEAFADRRYEPDGSLRARAAPGALLDDPALAAAQAVDIALRQRALAQAGQTIPLRADTICIHSDTPNALRMAHAIAEALHAAGVSIRAAAQPDGA